jgi:hypothetical protein
VRPREDASLDPLLEADDGNGDAESEGEGGGEKREAVGERGASRLVGGSFLEGELTVLIRGFGGMI